MNIQRIISFKKWKYCIEIVYEFLLQFCISVLKCDMLSICQITSKSANNKSHLPPCMPVKNVKDFLTDDDIILFNMFIACFGDIWRIFVVKMFLMLCVSAINERMKTIDGADAKSLAVSATKSANMISILYHIACFAMRAGPGKTSEPTHVVSNTMRSVK